MLRSRDQRGVAAVEFAIIGSLLFLILFGIIQFGIAFNRSQGLQAAAREGARIGALPATTVAEIEQRVRETVSIVPASALASGCPADPDTLGIDQGCIALQHRAPGGAIAAVSGPTAAPCNATSGGTVVVKVVYRTRIAIPLWVTQGVTLSGEGEFACES